MDPRQPTKSSEETIRDSSGTIERRTTETPGQRTEETSTIEQTPGGAVTRRESTAGISPSSAREYGRTKKIFHAYQILWYVLGLVDIILGLRFILKLTGANPDNGFATFIYGLSQPFAGPFLTLFHATPSQGAETTSYLEWSTIVAALMYVLIVWGIIKLLQMGKPTKPDEMNRTVSEQ